MNDNGKDLVREIGKIFYNLHTYLFNDFYYVSLQFVLSGSRPSWSKGD